MKKALLIIDMQKGLFTEASPRFDADGVVHRINQLSAKFRSNGMPVIFIQHDGIDTGYFEKKSWQWMLLDELTVNTADIFIDKYANDVFYNSELQSTLKNLNCSQLFITGCATDFCVESTIQSALSKDYNITVVADGHTTGDKPHLKAEKIIEHYNWIWQNMLPTKGDIEVKKFEELDL
jgi:nicotinamidase-related amidase